MGRNWKRKHPGTVAVITFIFVPVFGVEWVRYLPSNKTSTPIPSLKKKASKTLCSQQKTSKKKKQCKIKAKMLLPKSMENQQKSSANSKLKCFTKVDGKPAKEQCKIKAKMLLPKSMENQQKQAVQNQKQNSCYQSQSRTTKKALQKLCSFLL